MATSSIDIASALGIGSGINTKQLVSDLVAASREPKATALNGRISTNNARISALASAKSSLTTFSGALTELLKSTSYSGQPVSADSTIASVSLIEGGTPKGLPAQLVVTQLATAQVMQSDTLNGATAASTAGTGKITISPNGGTAFDVELTSPKNTLADLATAINDKNGGVTASIVTDSTGARLVLKGQTGATNSFTVAVDAGADAELQRFGGTAGALTQKQAADNAKISIDNVDMEFATNEVTTAIPYLRIDLNKAAPGTTVTLATDQPTATMTDLVAEFVSTYNSLKTALNTSTKSTDSKIGLLSSDPGVREMTKRLATLTSTELTDTGTYRTLSSIGIATNRDGTLTLDEAKLKKAFAEDPEAITQMLNPTTPSSTKIGIAGALKSVTDYLNGADGPLASSTATYTKLQEALTKQTEKLDASMENYEAQLTKTYSAMQTQLASIKATQSYLEQQIAIWNGTNN
ncbi:flagellar filament capping protein FliD [Sphingobium sufflavum]|uniref:flagellar filament capping protein FliD n=1 Tax=Sphingobium sufflavum TaxID=1129547 RepID=UPI001F411E5D|nr:flagellar filament capping protein FliD [Sphingobium sufflavum]MCE7795638.1 flagellar filament capping protein FliD [Sphingobium sufflavum]